jgi:hypothetical protein
MDDIDKQHACRDHSFVNTWNTPAWIQTATHPPRRKVRFQHRGIMRLRSRAGDPHRAGRELGERMREASTG